MKLKPDVTLWQHQRDEADFIKANPHTLLLAGCGVGKTLTVLTAIAEMGCRRALVLTVKTALRSVWQEEVDRFTEGAAVLVLDKGTSKDKAAALMTADAHADGVLIVVVNYETARLLPLNSIAWDFVVADESHKLKSHNSKQSVNLAEMLASVPTKVAMTGTAWEDRPTDVFGQVRFLEPKRYGKTLGSERLGSWSKFFDQYVHYRTVDNIKIPIRYINQAQLAEQLADILRYVDRDKVLDLPPVQHVTRKVWLDPAHMKAYRELKREMIVELGGDAISADNAMVLALRLHQIAGGFYQPDRKTALQDMPNGTAKLDALLDVLDEIGSEPVVVYTRFTEDVNRISKALKRLKIPYHVLVGGRDEHLLWRRGGGRVLIANIQAGSAGINLTRASYGVFYSTGYSNTDYTQACARIDRPGQTKPVTFYHIVAVGTVDEDIRAALSKKDITADTLLRLTNAF